MIFASIIARSYKFVNLEREVSAGIDSADHYMHDRVRGLRDGTEPLAVAGGEARRVRTGSS